MQWSIVIDHDFLNLWTYGNFWMEFRILCSLSSELFVQSLQVVHGSHIKKNHRPTVFLMSNSLLQDFSFSSCKNMADAFCKCYWGQTDKWYLLTSSSQHMTAGNLLTIPHAHIVTQFETFTKNACDNQYAQFSGFSSQWLLSLYLLSSQGKISWSHSSLGTGQF